jgi:hypothetical protein
MEDELRQRLQRFDALRAAVRRGRTAAGNEDDSSSGGGDR